MVDAVLFVEHVAGEKAVKISFLRQTFGHLLQCRMLCGLRVALHAADSPVAPAGATLQLFGQSLQPQRNIRPVFFFQCQANTPLNQAAVFSLIKQLQMVAEIGVGHRRCSLFVETFNDCTDNCAACAMRKLMGLLVVAPIFKAGVTVAAS